MTINPLIEDALSDLDEVMARTQAWEAVAPEQLSGWTIDRADNDRLRFKKQFGAERREALFRVPEEMTVPTEISIAFMAQRLLKIESEF